MICKNCSKKVPSGATVCQHCGTKLKISPPSAITVKLPNKIEVDAQPQRTGIRKGILAALIAAGVLVIAGLVVICLIVLQDQSAVAAPLSTEEAASEPTPTPEPTPDPTPTISDPEPTEEYSSIFERPEDDSLQ